MSEGQENPIGVPTRRDFFREVKNAAVAAVGLTAFGWLQPERPARAETFKPGEIAPETWGGAALLDTTVAYVKDPNFTGQVIFLHKHGQPTEDSFTFVLVAGKDAKGEIIKGSRLVEGWHSVSSLDELNISLGGGGGGAQLRYDQKTKDLALWMNGFAVYDGDKMQRITFSADVKVDPDRSRILHSPLPSDILQYYMREGYETFENSQTSGLMVVHASIRQIPLRIIEDKLEVTTPAPIAVFGANNNLVVIQPDSDYFKNRKMTSFLWRGSHDMSAKTEISIGTDTDKKSGASFPVLGEAKIQSSRIGILELKTEIEPASDYAITIEQPTPKGVLTQTISLPTLQATQNDHDWGVVMTQTTNINSLLDFLQRYEQAIQ